MQSINIEQLAGWFLNKEPMTHKKLQKLCYYAVAWGWALRGENIVSNDQFEAWVHGPVAPRLYHKYKEHGWSLIPAPNSTSLDDDSLIELLDAVWVTYGDKSGNELEALSHSETPWRKARGGLLDKESSHAIIDGDVMASFYNSIKSTEY